jgi:heme exporter protein D
MNWSEFFDMGGYALYVWGSYAAAAIVLVFNIVAPFRRRESLRRQLKEFYRNREDSQ